MKIEITDIVDDFVSLKIDGEGHDLKEIAHEYMANPPTMPCAEGACPVESWNEADGSWLLTLRIKDPRELEALQSGEAEIRPLVDCSGLRFVVADTESITKATVTTEPGVCEYCRAQIGEGKMPPYHDHCRCRTVEKGSKLIEVLKMSSCELAKLNKELETIAKSFIRKSNAPLTKADLAVKNLLPD